MMMSGNLMEILSRYDVAVPRYTSYPPVPNWNFSELSREVWERNVAERFQTENKEVCLYIHLPYCEELCTYCACNKRITKNHDKEKPYIKALINEWEYYLKIFDETPVIREIHLGGGTPTFFSPGHLEMLLESILSRATIAADHEFSIEVHPNNTTREHLKVLRRLGFNRISIGVQDFDPLVQFMINRIQTFEKTREVNDLSRDLGYNSVNVDLIYGLPFQTEKSIEETIDKIALIKPDRLAYYSYAHVPWKSKAQRRYSEKDLPGSQEKLTMYSLGYHNLLKMGYESIGMDHFAISTDKLLTAYKAGKLHRNFMGYTTTDHKLVIGLGTSAISDTWSAYAQNEKEVEAYEYKVKTGIWPLVNGHIHTFEELSMRLTILDLMCRDMAVLQQLQILEIDYLHSLEDDGLITIQNNVIQVLPKGKLLIRNICAALDPAFKKVPLDQRIFSRAI